MLEKIESKEKVIKENKEVTHIFIIYLDDKNIVYL